MAYILQQRLPDHVRHSPRRRRDRTIGQVSIAGGGLDLGVAEEFSDHRQPLLDPSFSCPRAQPFSDTVGDLHREAHTSGPAPKIYLRVRLDDPSLPAPFTAALFFADNGEEVQLVEPAAGVDYTHKACVTVIRFHRTAQLFCISMRSGAPSKQLRRIG